MKITERGVGGLLDKDDMQAVIDLCSSGDSLSFSGVRDRFEQAVAAYCGARQGVSCTSCSSALLLAYRCLGLGPGDEIISTPQSYQNTVIPAYSLGATVRFADIDPATLNIAPETIAPLLSQRTKAVVVTHYGGNPVAMERVREVLGGHPAALIEDAAHALGSARRGQRIGSTADISCLSFQSLKNITTLGEGGMMLFQDPELGARGDMLVNNGILGARVERPGRAIGPWVQADPPLLDHSIGSFAYDFESIEGFGMNNRMSDVQAAVGLTQMKKLDALNARRTEVAGWYNQALSRNAALRLWAVGPEDTCSHHLYPVFLRGADQTAHDKIVNHLHHAKGIEMILRYFPMHLSHYARHYGSRQGDCPVCERVWFTEQLNLPIHPAMSREDVEYVAQSLEEATSLYL